MKNLKVGDRVRINCPKSRVHNCEAVIWDIGESTDVDTWRKCITFFVDIAGRGKFAHDGYEIAFEAHELEPIIPLSTWEEFQQVTGIDIRKPVTV